MNWTHTIGMIAAILTLSLIALSQNNAPSLIVNGGAGSAPMLQVNGKNYVEVESLARAVNGSLSFNGNQVILTLPSASDTTSHAPAGRTGDASFSSDFLRAGIEAMSSLREWHSVLTSAIENGYPITQEAMAPYQGQAVKNLRLAQAAATTDGDQKGARVIANEYDKMKQLSDKYVKARANMNYTGQDALTNDPMNHSLVACGTALSGMAASGQFTDDINCH